MTDPISIADMAELRYVSDEERRIARHRRRRGFSYVGHDGSPVPPRIRVRIRRLAHGCWLSRGESALLKVLDR